MLGYWNKCLGKLLLVLMGIFLVSCSPQESSPAHYTLLYTTDFATFGSQSALVSYDDKGQLVDKKALGGALYYNLLPEEQGFSIDNGQQALLLTPDGHEKTVFPELRGYFEAGHYLERGGQRIKFYNYGIDEAGIDEASGLCLTTIAVGENLLTIRGFLHGFQAREDGVYLLLQPYPDEHHPYFLSRLDWDKLSVETLGEVALNPEVASYFFSQAVSSDVMLGLVTHPVTQPQQLVRLTLEKSPEVSSFWLPELFAHQLDERTFFTYDNRYYIFDKVLDQLYELKLDEETQQVVVTETGLRLGGQEESFIIKYQIGHQLYVLSSGLNQVTEIDLPTLTVTKQTILEPVSGLEDMKTYSFRVNQQ